jgi:pyruvate, orthophosphate dikinase
MAKIATRKKVSASGKKPVKSGKSVKYVYYFGGGKAEGNGKMKDLLGGKGAGLAEMTNLKIPVPAGFTITTVACNEFFSAGMKHPAGLWEQALTAIKKVEKDMGLKYGDPINPLLVSVRSGAKFSMPGMMDTVLNLGLTPATLVGIIKKTGNQRFAYDAYRRFITMFGSIVMGVDRMKFEHALEDLRKERGVTLDTDLDAGDLMKLVDTFKRIYETETASKFPDDPYQQLKMAINAVFGSWFGERAKKYRKLNNIPDDLGTACNVQSMVFGNIGDNSGTGVGFTRDPSTGERKFFAECLINAQGEDVVAGIRTPLHIEELKRQMPKAYAELKTIYQKLEKHYKDMLDIEFTVQEGKLYMLQTRVGKRTAAAALKIAVDMVKEKMIDKKTALLRIDPMQFEQLMHPMIDPKAQIKCLCKGLPASPGAAVGQVVFTAEEAEKAAAEGRKVILVRTETSPEDIGGMHAAQGILTARGGMTSHAAVVGRGMGKCCVVGCGAIDIHEKEGYFIINGCETVREGDYVTLNGTMGEVMLGAAPLVTPEMKGDFNTIMKWADEIRTLGVRTNSDTPQDAAVTMKFGADGIGLVRTEHMFFEGDRIKSVREMILSDTKEERERALAKLLPMQKDDFINIFKEMKGLPVTIRLLDPPLHEFLPHTEEEIREIAAEMNVSAERLTVKNRLLHEANPMLGHRGCRLAITWPEIYEMQVRAIMEAACELTLKKVKVVPEIMIPLTASIKEYRIMHELTVRIAEEVKARFKAKAQYTVGTMIELPRACIISEQIAELADFYSYGTNDLTQTIYGLSRDDAGRFLPKYVEEGIMPHDPFMSLDQEGVGFMMELATKKGRAVKKNLKLGICGEHGGDPESVEYCHRTGLTYVSCSPYRVPVAKLAAAHAALKEKGKEASRSTV